MLYPLKFKPYLKFYPYGGRRFAQILHKEGVPNDRDVAECWEISDHGQEQSTVVNGPLAGKTLRELMTEFQGALVGTEVWDRYGDYFPLLVKFLDCDKRLPAHLHPNDEQAKRLGLKDTGKTEAWYIVRAEEGAVTYCGARDGLTPDKFREAIRVGDNFDGVMNRVETTTGETYFVPPGRLHALDSGNLVFEIQQNSDAGFGWDWAGFVEAGVIDAEVAREHPELAIACASYESGSHEQTDYVVVEELGAERTFCAVSRHFVLERWNTHATLKFVGTPSRFQPGLYLAGQATFRGGGQEVTARFGESLLVPAGLELEIEPEGEISLLTCYVPQLHRDVIEPLRERGITDDAIAGLGSYGNGNDLLPLLQSMKSEQ